MYNKRLLFTSKFGMMKFVQSSEFDVIRKTVMATKLNDGDSLVSIEIINENVVDYDDEFLSVELSGGSDEGYNQMLIDFERDSIVEETTSVIENLFAVLQTNKGIFIKFKLSEISEMKKGAIGVRGIRLTPDDFVENAYVLYPGDNIDIEYSGKTVELRKLKATKRDTKGTKIRL